MSKELPEYERHQAVTPAQQSGSFTQALSGAAASSDSISNLGAQIAQSASNEMATLRGLEAGKTPGRQLFPTMGEADKHFVQAYKQQEYAIASTQGTDLLRKLSFEATKNPTPASLQDYEKNAHQGLEGILGNVTPGTEAELRKAFDENYSSTYYQVAESVEKQNNKIMGQNLKLFYDDRVKQIQDLRAAGDNKAAEELKVDTTNRLKEQAGNRVLTKPEAQEMALSLQKIDEIAEAKRELVNADIIGLGEKLLADQAKLPRTAENDRRADAMLEAYNQRKSYEAAENGLLLDGAIGDLEAHRLGPAGIIDLQSKMNAPTFAKFQRHAEQYFRKQKEQQDGFDFINANSDNAYRLGGVDAASRDKFLDAEVAKIAQVANSNGIPYEDNMATRVATAAQYKMNFPGLDKRIDAAIQGGSPEQSMMAMTELEKASKQYKNPFLLQGVSKESLAKATAFKRYMEGGNSPADAYLKANADITNLTPGEKEARTQRFTEKTARNATYDMSSLDTMTKTAAKALGFDSGLVPPSLAMRFQTQLKINNDYGKTFEDALEMTGNEMRKTWGYTTINGSKEIMYMPPEMFVYGGEYAENLIHNQVIEQFNTVAAEYKELYQNNKSQDFYLELNSLELNPSDKASEANYRGGPIGITTGGTVRAKKIYRDGTVVKGMVNLESDDRTPTTGSAPNYIISFATDNTSTLIQVPSNGWRPLRYIPNVEALKREAATNPDLSAAEQARQISKDHKSRNKKLIEALERQNKQVGYIAP